MSLRTKAAEVKERGVQQRGNWTPPETAKKIYDYWLKESNSTKSHEIWSGKRKENFCHFWRCVAIWGPLFFLGNVIMDVGPWILGILGGVALVVAIIALVTIPGAWLMTLLGVGIASAAVLNVIGLCAGISLALTPEQRKAADLFQETKPALIFAATGLPASIAGYGLAWLVKGALKLSETKQGGITLAALGGASVYGLIALFWGGQVMAFSLGLTAVAAAFVGGAIFTCVHLSDYVQGRRALAKEKAYSQYADSDQPAPTKYRPPSKFKLGMKRFFRTLGDVVVFVAQVVRVKKWGVCPLVEIDTGQKV